jgi:lysyl-tRNA synthetase class 2
MSEQQDQGQDSQRAKLSKLRELGVQPYAYRWDRDHSASEVISAFDRLSETKTEVSLAGRLMSKREHGKTQFGHVQDASGRIQVYLRKDTIGEDAFARLALLDIGDMVGIRGEVFRTKTGEITILVKEIVLLAKALRPLPEKFHGLKDVELRYRQRYLDLIVNPGSRGVFLARARICSLIRQFLDERGFIEVETPTLQPLYGGAAAMPFKTLYNVLDQEMFLRISDELYLKRLIVGGMERVYEMCKDFRNEGLDRIHNPEFTQVELYQAYADYTDMMTLTEELFRFLAQELHGSTEMTFDKAKFDLGKPWKRLRFTEALAEKTGKDVMKISDPELRAEARRLGVELPDNSTRAKVLGKLFDELVQDRLVEPTFVMDYPKITCPLAKQLRDDPELVERFEPVVCGMEVGNAFSELNDPVEQRQRFEDQLARNEEFATLDQDYVAALEYGMPPTGGLGLGVDRITMLLTDNSSIRDVILFPQLRPVKDS